MLPNADYLKKFKELQPLTVTATDELIKWIAPGQSEKEIADKYYSLLKKYGFKEHWYPVLIYSGDMTGKPISRRIHLPSETVIVKENDIVFVDSTPMQGTVWTNWCETFVVGDDKFLQSIVDDTKEIIAKTAAFAKNEAETVGDLYKNCVSLVKGKDMEMLDPYKDVGHSIFQVPEGQTVDKTPMEDRLLLSEKFSDTKLSGIISIEPQLGRINPADNKMYGAKLQEVLYF